MPFLPFIVLLAWQALSKSASFALGWATALYFGQVPGKQGRVLAVMCLAAAAWVILTAGFAVPLLVGAVLDFAGVIERNFTVQPLHALGLTAAIVLTPPALAAATLWAEFHEDRSVGGWLRLVPASYPATASLGAGVLLMVLITPVALVQRLLRKRRLVQTAVSMRPDSSDDDLVEAVGAALRSLGIERIAVKEQTGFLSWPMRTVGFAARHLIGAVVRGEPMRLEADGLDLFAYATNVSIIGPTEKAFRARAALQRELPMERARITWSDDAQELEDALLDVRREMNGDIGALQARLDEIQHRMDSCSLDLVEWNLLYRLRLQVEREGLQVASGGSGGRTRRRGG
ncbi:MAG TPA: hypothetical protein VFH63_04475 [candidate division Zixibacteria bacterium]|nr:hypothetical protein [candidate division Zixibacteria bacterium]